MSPRAGDDNRGPHDPPRELCYTPHDGVEAAAPQLSRSTMPAQYEPKLEFAFTVKIALERAFWIRPPDIGCVRAGIYLKDGTFEGPNIRGIVIPGSGADWPLVRPNGVIDFDARYMLQEEDGSVIYLQNRGFRWGPKDVMDAMARNEPVDHSQLLLPRVAEVRSARGQARLGQPPHLHRRGREDSARQSDSLLQARLSGNGARPWRSDEQARFHRRRRGLGGLRARLRASPRMGTVRCCCSKRVAREHRHLKMKMPLAWRDTFNEPAAGLGLQERARAVRGSAEHSRTSRQGAGWHVIRERHDVPARASAVTTTSGGNPACRGGVTRRSCRTSIARRRTGAARRCITVTPGRSPLRVMRG